MDTIEERKKHSLTVTKHINDKPYKWNELSLAVEGRSTNLCIRLGNEKSIADGCGKTLIYIRLDKYNAYSAPFSQKSFNYLDKPKTELKELLSFYEFGKTDIKHLDRVLRITKNLKHRHRKVW